MAQFHLADLFEIVTTAVPDRVALCDDKGQVTFSEMNQRADRLASGLQANGIRRGDSVGLYLMNGPEYLESFFAIVKIGAVPFNVNYRYGLDELQYLFGNADTKAIIHGAEFSPLVKQLKSTLPHIKLSIAIEDGQGADPTMSGSLPYETLMTSDAQLSKFERSEEDYMLQYTGGTTGLPKGVMWPHKAFFYACLGGGGLYARKPPISHPDEQAEIASTSFPIRILPLAPLMHGAAIWATLSALLAGITVVLDPMRGGFDAERIWDRVERENVNVLQIVGDAMAVPLIQALEQHPERWDLSRLINFGSGGAVFSQHLKDKLKTLLPNIMITDGMGTSETGISGMAAPTIKDGFMRLPIDEHQAVITDGRIAKPGEVGFLSRTGHTPIGYYNDPDKTAEIFVKIDNTLWVMTGDQARVDEDGLMTVLGRGSTCINSGGEKIYPEEVEEVLREHPAVHDAAVVGTSSERWGEQVSAVISLTDHVEAPTLDNLQDFCRDRLAGYKLPRALKVVPTIERSPAGKQNYTWAKSQFESQ